MDPTESDFDRSSLKDEVRRFSEAVRVVYTVVGIGSTITT